MTNFFKTRYKGEKRTTDKFLGGYIPQELFDQIILISAHSGKTKTCLILEAFAEVIKQKYSDRGKLESEVIQRASRTWNIVKTENSTPEDFIKNVKYELKTLGLSQEGMDRIIKIAENGKN